MAPCKCDVSSEINLERVRHKCRAQEGLWAKDPWVEGKSFVDAEVFFIAALALRAAEFRPVKAAL